MLYVKKDLYLEGKGRREKEGGGRGGRRGKTMITGAGPARRPGGLPHKPSDLSFIPEPRGKAEGVHRLLKAVLAAGEKEQLVRCLLHKAEDLSSITRSPKGRR